MAKKVVRPREPKKKLPKDFYRLVNDPSTGLGALQAVFDEHDVNARGGYGDQTALMMCHKNAGLVRWLIARGADVNAVDEFGYTALHEAVREGSPAVMLALLEHGASVTKRTLDGDTPLHCAAEGRNLDGVKVLLDRRAAPNAKNGEELTPLELALENCSNDELIGALAVAEALLEAGARKSQTAREFTAELAHAFELERADVDPERAARTAGAMKKLCQLFGVALHPIREMHDGQSKIVVRSRKWQKQHAELRALLVPGFGPAPTIQGEVVRITSQIADEIQRNGGINWNRGYIAMGKALVAYLESYEALDRATLADFRKILAQPPGDTETDRLSKAAVAWVLANPIPIALRKVTHGR
jgi:hypothetical protein